MTSEMKNLPMAKRDTDAPPLHVPIEPGLPFDQPDDAPAFDGDTYDPAQDHQRLGKQAIKVFKAMRYGEWWTLSRLADWTSYPEASISARLRDFRKPRFGAHTIERRRTQQPGLWQYRLLVNPQARLDLLGIDEQKNGA